MTDLLPYIPRNTNGITEDLWKKGHSIWISQLTNFLGRDDSYILEESSKSLLSWCQSVLQQQLDHDNIDPQVLHLVFLVYVRLGTVISATTSTCTLPSLDTFSLVFARTNPAVVRNLFSQLFETQKNLRDLYINSVDQLVDTLEAVGGCISSMVNSESNWKQPCLERILVVTRLLESKVLCLDTFIPRLFPALFSCYEQLLEQFTPIVQNDGVDIGYWVYLVKQSLVNTFNTLVEINYISPLGYATMDQSGHLEKINNVKTNEAEAIVESLSDQVLLWIEQSGIESSKDIYVDAPLIMDWQNEWKMAKRLEHINQDLFSGENEQLSFLSLVLETQIQELASGIQQSWGNRIKNQHFQQEVYEEKSTASSTHLPTPLTESPHRNSLISQVRDIFSDLGEGFVEACLEANNDDAEMVIMQLLEDNLPPSVASLDRTMERTTSSPLKETTKTTNTSILDSRKNIFDKDEFDVFSGGIVEQNKVYLGKKNQGTAETLLENKKHTKDEKANMLRRIYDMYEDEIDDSYDSVNEMPGPVDLADVDEGGQSALDVVRAKKEQAVDPGAMHESELVHMFVDHPQVFDRSSATRKSTQRDALRKRTNMSDEQIEGWAIMFNRNPRKQRILDKYMLFDGSQEEVAGNVKAKQQQQKESQSKPPPPSETKQRAYKDKNKARFGNHNRKKNHDKKLNKLAGPPP